MNFEAVLFDCDGVLVDSEPLTNGVLRDMLGELGWVMTVEQCMAQFVGKAVMDEVGTIEARTGFKMTEAWMATFRQRRNDALVAQLQAIPNIHAAVKAVHAHFSGRIACASGADRHKVELQLEKVGLMPFFEGRVFSGHEMPRSKPAPDVYLAAAAALGVDPRRCAVVEDTVTGVTAGVAAGATVFGYSPGGPGHSTVESLMAVGAAQVFTDMAQLPALLGAPA
ncbi:HAD family phosphatase [Pseudorhodoferax sp. Leaf267]|uniref:HAD family hydrolase n=1 Tax=Pseudorhodoferax sp. Leaf267 TaxID=1736316 RepID=UPI0006FB9B94|nr:HAD family phosphatase [Pseudorhodoferax sp. Leaf267]KQP14217.1 HAD family hydrolase [Pseudorhodoferax sp. Leaf267]